MSATHPSTAASPAWPLSSADPSTSFPPRPAAAALPSPPQAEWIAVAKDLTAGTAGAMAGIIVGQPLDTVKTRMQSSQQYRGVLHCILQTARQEGPRAFFKGMASPLMGNGPINAIVFSARGNMNRLLDTYVPRTPADKASGRPSYWREGVASFWAGMCQCVVSCPVELVKCRMQVQVDEVATQSMLRGAAGAVAAVMTGNPAAAAASSAPTAPAAPVYHGSFDCVRQIYRRHGIRGLYAGWWVTFWRDCPAYAAWFLGYEATKSALISDADMAAGKPVSTSVALAAGSVAGITTWISTYPLDVLKSVIQTAPPGTPPRDLKMMAVARRSYRAHGWRWFWKGITPTLVRAVPVSAVTFYIYERCMDFLAPL